MNRRRARLAGAVIALGLGSGLLGLVACETTDKGFSDPPPEAGPDQLSLAEAGPTEAAAPLDASDDYSVPDGAVVCDASPCVVSLTGAAGTYCALRSDGLVACWGNNLDGQLAYDAGMDTLPVSGNARTVSNLTGVTSVGVGDGNACARIADGGVFCWGNADLVNAGRTATDGGAPLDTPVLKPTRESAVPNAAMVGVGAHTGCVTSPAGAVTCWGKNASSELGRPVNMDAPLPPAPVPLGGKTIASVAPADSRTFAITTTGELASWGGSTFQGSGGFLLGRDTSEDPDPLPAIVPGLTHVRAVASGQVHSCAVVGRFVDCWGTNENGQLGRGQFNSLAYLPGASRLSFTVEAEDIDAGATASTDIPLHVAAGDAHSCVVMGSGRVYCWGANAAGQLGPEVSSEHSGYPVHIKELGGPAVQVAAGRGSVCALLRAGVVQCWGANYLGDLGRGAVDDLPHPHPQSVAFPP